VSVGGASVAVAMRELLVVIGTLRRMVTRGTARKAQRPPPEREGSGR
jgi:hypothetical protein